MECPHCGGDTNKATCKHCGREIYYDHSSGFWIHADFGKVDGMNGLYCSPGMWDGTEERKYATPLRS